ncbi:MAG: hypothetical protein KGL39_37845 [Patescibacteria group bacterium]|nr:hypothetical protein [Patescibacteria group bacterium]
MANADTGERWIFLFDAESLPALYGCLGRYAADPELNFSWYDAAVCSQSARRLLAEQRPRD